MESLTAQITFCFILFYLITGDPATGLSPPYLCSIHPFCSPFYLCSIHSFCSPFSDSSQIPLSPSMFSHTALPTTLFSTPIPSNFSVSLFWSHLELVDNWLQTIANKPEIANRPTVTRPQAVTMHQPASNRQPAGNRQRSERTHDKTRLRLNGPFYCFQTQQTQRQRQ